jgi:CheY-like chemotaxis protein
MHNFSTVIDFYTGKQIKSSNVVVVTESEIVENFLKKQLDILGYNIIISKSQDVSEVVLKYENKPLILLLDCLVFDATMIQQITKLKQKCSIPTVVIVDPESNIMQDSLKIGICYYIAKPINPDVLNSVLQAVMFDLNQQESLLLDSGNHINGFSMMESSRFSFRTLNETENLAVFISNCFPNPKRALLGVGELMINAIEHGNLEIGYELKTELVQNGTWRTEIESRLTMPEYCNRTASVTLTKKIDGIYMTIEDMGAGFAWQDYMLLDPARMSDNHGRGIALANATSFDRLTYNSVGNKAIAYMANEDEIDFC